MSESLKQTLLAYKQMAKLRIVYMVLVTTAIGYLLGRNGAVDWIVLLSTLFGTGAAAAGAAALNNFVEREVDGRMERTCNRPLPAGILDPAQALAFGVLLVLGGVGLLLWKVNLLAAFIVLLTAFLYVLVYTPLKKVTWLNTSIGAIPGAMPPLAGWVAASGELHLGAWILFFILFAWQHPHFYAIAWMYRDDYARGGLKMLPVVEPSGRRMFRHIEGFSILLIGVSILPTATGMMGILYLVGALVLGFMLLWYGMVLTRTRTIPDARKLLRASVIYLPLLLVLIVLDLAV
jgi:protoheme IX farnesyltransferase